MAIRRLAITVILFVCWVISTPVPGEQTSFTAADLTNAIVSASTEAQGLDVCL